ncbi:MAG: hypothetical protein KatS3mg108_0398 [Isosphaeraceae bacterium]|nr:MAG: hypothetical protein KatS3mg108_0398 [Isosphaeraceae bacterium]
MTPLAALVLAFVPAAGAAEELRLPITRDTWVSAVGNEATANLGAAPRLKLKSIQEMTLIDIDPTPLRGRRVERATLHLKLAGPERLHRVTVGTIAAPWEEGASPTYQPGAPGASFRFRSNPRTPWSEPDGDLTSVILGQAGSFWRMADASDPDADGWQSIPVDPAILEARAAGRSFGMLVFDDTGTEWTRDGDRYDRRLFPNRFVHSRESGPEHAPYFTVTLGEGPPRPVATVRPEPPPTPVAAAPLPPLSVPPFDAAADVPQLGSARVHVLDELDVRPAVGPSPLDGAAPHLWDPAHRRVRLHAARNEFVAFQVVLEGSSAELNQATATLTIPAPRVRATLGRYVEVPAGDAWIPDPVLPLDRAPRWPDVPGRERRSFHVELYVGHDTPAGLHRGALHLAAEGERLDLTIELNAWNATLPDRLSFLPEMNAYELPPNERDYYRLAHLHRVVLNRVPYYQNGRVADGCAPVWDGRRLDWTEYDRRFGPLLDGSLFADLPRRGVPVECFYLPIHENWPTPIEPHYNGNDWADLAFTPEYRAALVEVSRQFADHARSRGWHFTLFQGFLNGKCDFKRNGWSRGSSPWLLDEPANFTDFWALRWFGSAMHEGWHAAGLDPAAGPRMVFRADISRPQWQRDALDGLLDYNVVSNAAYREYGRLIRQRKARQHQIVLEYGGANPIGAPNLQAVAWCLDAWTRGADGVVPWQTIGTRDAWTRAEETALFYPGRAEDEPPAPSIRLKAFRRGQQDVELLTLSSQATAIGREPLAAAVRAALSLDAHRLGTEAGGAEDAGRLAYDQLDPLALWSLRTRIAAALSALAPPPRDQLVEFRTPPRDPSRLEPRTVPGSTNPGRTGFVGRPTSPTSPPPPGARRVTLAGPQAVRDTLIDPARPDQPLASLGRENALVKNQTPGAFLVAFTPAALGPIQAERLHSATLTLYVWDPSTQGRTRLDALPLTTPWDAAAASWNHAAAGRHWATGSFDPAHDCGPPAATTVVEPDAPGTDTADPPIAIRLDLTETVRGWLRDPASNHGLALVPVPDRSIDEGYTTRLQLYGSEERTGRFGPRLDLILAP